MGGTSLAAYEGDAVLARSRRRLNIPMIQSGASLTPLEGVRAVGPTAWFQAYLPGEPGIITPLVERAQRAGLRNAGAHGGRAGGRQPREQCPQRL